jgi:hypothetical protein
VEDVMGNGNPTTTQAPPVPQPAASGAASTPAINGAAPSSTPAPWYANFGDPDLRGWTELKKFENPEAAMKSAREMERFRGVPVDQLIRKPQPDAEGKIDWTPVFEGAGAPKTPQEYQIPVVNGGEEFVRNIVPVVHEARLTQWQLDRLVPKWNEVMTRMNEAADQARLLEYQADDAKLHQEWPGQTYTEREEIARRFAQQIVAPALGIGPGEELTGVLKLIEESVGTAKFLKIMAKAGESLGESRFVAGRANPTFGMTPDGARARMKELNADADFRARVMRNGKDGPEMQEMDRLARVAAGNLPR